MGETDIHRNLMFDLIGALTQYYSNQSNVYVSGNILLYYQKGDPRESISPDVLVTLGLDNHARELYKVWEEGKAPDLVIEVTSKSTQMRDIGRKKGIYEALGVREYLLFDPRKEYLQPRFRVYRLENGNYVPVIVQEETGYYSSVLDLIFRVEQNDLRIFDPKQATLLPNPAEQAQIALQATQLADQEAKRADKEAQRADKEAQRADQEAQRANRLALRLQELGISTE